MLKHNENLCGFSTQVLLTRTINEQKLRVIFSGDTIIDSQHRNSLALPLAWGKKMISLIEDAPDTPLFWLLTTKGYKTYRYLPVFFINYFPSLSRNLSSFEKELLLRIAKEMFGHRLDTEHWIIRASDTDQRLKLGVADITDTRRNIREIAYFEKINPGHVRGDELVCLTRCCRDNINPLFFKKLLNYEL